MVARRPAQAMTDGEVFSTGKYRFRMLLTPHVPHCWEASLLFEETQGTLFCSDLFHQNGDVEPSTSADVVGRFKQTLSRISAGPAGELYAVYAPHRIDAATAGRRSSRKPLAAMHGSTFVGDGAQALYRCRAGHQRSCLADASAASSKTGDGLHTQSEIRRDSSSFDRPAADRER